MDPKLRQKLLDLGVGLIYRFGSTLEGSATPSSDVDVGIVFSKPASLKHGTTIRLEIDALLSPLFGSRREMDVALLQEAGPAFQYEVIRRGQILYEISPEFRADYEEQIMNEYLDLEPLLQVFREGLLTRS